MKKSYIFTLCLFLLGCESEKIDASKPVDIDKTVALFCKEANKKLSKGSHIIVRKKDFESINMQSKEYIYWKIVQNFTDLEGISTHDNDNVTAQDLTDNGEIFTISVRVEKWAGMPYYKGFFSMNKNGVKATDKSILRKEYAMKIDDFNLTSAEEQPIEENGIGSLKIINQSEDIITDIRIYKGDSLLMNNRVNIRSKGGETLELASGEYKLQIKDNFNEKFCSVGTFKITNEQTETKTYRGCK
jgi:hypothetical protein